MSFVITSRCLISDHSLRSTTSRTESDVRKILVACSSVVATQEKIAQGFAGNNRTHANHLEALNERTFMLQDGILSKNDQCVADLQITQNQQTEIVRAFPHNGPIVFESKQMSAVTAVGIRTAHFHRSACKPWCICRCHATTQWQTPHRLVGIFGWIYVDISGWQSLQLACDSTECRLPSQPMARVTYFFPTWFLARAVSLMLSSTPLAGPVASLKVQRTVSQDAAIFTYARIGDVEKVKYLFEQGLASPHDVSYRSGVTALHVRIPNFQS